MTPSEQALQEATQAAQERADNAPPGYKRENQRALRRHVHELMKAQVRDG